jgi:diadenosine tetraphosphate (Ap4A) HIT family hydrolase
VSCLACEAQAPGGRILETPGWIVEHTVGSLGLGTLIVKTRRHVLHVGDLTEQEATELGPLLRRVAAAVSEIAEPSQVYVALWSHENREPGHVHFVVQPVSRELMDELEAHGPRLHVALFDRGQPPDLEAAAAFADRVRKLLHDGVPRD